MKVLYVTDLDGTLLNTRDRISPYSIRVINHLVEQGMIFTYATARSLVSASVVTQGLSTQIPVITYNGALIIHPSTGEVISSIHFTAEEQKKVRLLLQKKQIYPLVYSYIEGREQVSWYQDQENEGIKRYLSLRKGDRRLRPLHKNHDEAGAALYAGDIFYYTCIGTKEQVQPVYEALRDHPAYTCTLQQELYRPEYWCKNRSSTYFCVFCQVGFVKRPFDD